jgi:hypothetical protein
MDTDDGKKPIKSIKTIWRVDHGKIIVETFGRSNQKFQHVPLYEHRQSKISAKF